MLGEILAMRFPFAGMNDGAGSEGAADRGETSWSILTWRYVVILTQISWSDCQFCRRSLLALFSLPGEKKHWQALEHAASSLLKKKINHHKNVLEQFITMKNVLEHHHSRSIE